MFANMSIIILNYRPTLSKLKFSSSFFVRDSVKHAFKICSIAPQKKDYTIFL